MPPTARRWDRKRVIFVLIAWAAILLLAEGAVRAIHPRTGRPAYYGYPAGLIVPDAELGHRYAPGFRGYFASPRYQDIPIEINRWGYRDVDWTQTPDPARPRVLVLGDSITFGSPLAVEERFTNRAAAVLAREGRTAELCNAGVNGYAVEQYDTLLRRIGPEFAPQLVLIGLCLNDAEPVSAADDARIRAAEEAARHGTATRIKERLKAARLDFDKSYLLNLGRAAVEEWLWRSPRWAPRMAERYAAKTRGQLEAIYREGGGLARLEKHLSAMRDYAAGTLHAGLAVVVFPYHHQLYEDRPWIQSEVDGLLTELGVPFTDLTPGFAPHRDEPDFYAYQDDCHPGARGHALAGEAAAALIAEGGIR